MINNNVINGFTVAAGVDELGAIVVQGLPGGETREISILSNTVSGGYQPDTDHHAGGIEIKDARDVRVELNKITDYYLGIELVSVESSNVVDNDVINTAETSFPAGIVARDITDTDIQAGRTEGYVESVDRG
ncbi:hypothetical protein ACQCX2_06835 [Propionibacteriaceae bacterium Y1700]|uniref:hypothetical protein n=1 Tax=Microlunatus sp. Y1700 TaxID=3418487 RepID=UPI003DA74636